MLVKYLPRFSPEDVSIPLLLSHTAAKAEFIQFQSSSDELTVLLLDLDKPGERLQACRSTELQRYTSFFYSLAELSKKPYFSESFLPGLFSGNWSFFSQFSGWLGACCHGLTPAAAVIGDGISTDSLGAFSTQPSEERASLKDQEMLLKYNFSAPFGPLPSG